jgi:trigger factor
MSYTKKTLEDSQVELMITVTPTEYAKHLENAAKRLSERTAIKGFRKGHVPYDIIKREVGEMPILQEALERVVQEAFFQAVKEENLETIGMPQIAIEKLAPDNDVVFKAVVGLLPKVELADVGTIKVEKKKKDVGDEKINETLDAIRGMHAKEIIKSGAAEGTDKLVIDMNMLLDNVPIEGGQAKDYQVYLSEDHYVPGFNEHVKGLKKNDKKEFSLEFPVSHYQKMLAGKKVDIKVKVKDVYERQLPELSDALAKKLGQDSVEKLKDLIRNNLEQEAEKKALQAVEIEILDKMIEGSTYDPIPPVIIDAEKQKMFFELKRDIEKNGLSIEDYLRDLKKTEEELFTDFAKQAEKRAKAALLSREVAKKQNITIEDTEIDSEIEMMKGVYKDDEEIIENLKKPEVRESIASQLQNKKVVEWLKKQVLETDNSKEAKK